MDPTAEDSLAEILARSRLGIAIAAMIRMIATTIKSSISENPFCFFMSSPCQVSSKSPHPNDRNKGPSARKKQGRKLVSLPCSTDNARLLLNDLCARYSSASSRAGADGRAGRVKADHAGLVHAKGALARAADVEWRRVGFKPGKGFNRRARPCIRDFRELVAALRRRRRGRQYRVNQAGRGSGRHARGGTPEICNER